MKHKWYFFLYLFYWYAIGNEAPIVEFTLTPAWKKLVTPQIATQRSAHNWILACTIDIKKKGTLEPLFLEKLLLSWKGSNLDHLVASLYKKPLDKDFMPIQDYLVCESEWSARTQRVIFKLNKPLHIETHTILCLVFSLPEDKQTLMNDGYFEFERSTLPYLIQQSLSNEPIRLTYHLHDSAESLQG